MKNRLKNNFKLCLFVMLTLLFACFASCAAASTQKKAAPEKKQDAFKKKLDGEWSGIIMTYNGSQFKVKLSIKRSGDKLRGKFTIGTDAAIEISNGIIRNGDAVCFTVINKASKAPAMNFLLMWTKEDVLKGGFSYGKDTDFAGMALLNRK